VPGHPGDVGLEYGGEDARRSASLARGKEDFTYSFEDETNPVAGADEYFITHRHNKRELEAAARSVTDH
jgi:hypothetical protein